MQGGHAGDALCESPLGQHGAVFVEDDHVVVVLGLVITNEDQPSSCSVFLMVSFEPQEKAAST